MARLPRLTIPGFPHHVIQRGNDRRAIFVDDSDRERYLSALRSCWNWGRAAGLVPTDHVWPPRVMLPEPKGRVRSLSDDELAALMQDADVEVVQHTAYPDPAFRAPPQPPMLRAASANRATIGSAA